MFNKKKYVSLFNFSPATEEVEENEKKTPNKIRKIIEKKICLSVVLHHFAILPVLSLLKLNIGHFFELLHYQIFKIITSFLKILKLIIRCASWT